MLSKQKVFFKIPDNFEDVTLLSKNYLHNTEDSLSLDILKNKISDDSHMRIFIDTLDYFNTLFFMEGERIRLNDDAKDILNKSIRKGLYQIISIYWKANNLDLIENKVTAGKYPYLKIKYRIKLTGLNFFQTNYFINTMNTTVGVGIMSKSPKDYETDIKTVAIKKMN